MPDIFNYYNPETDQLDVYLRSGFFDLEQIDNSIWFYRRRRSREILGLRMAQVSKFLQRTTRVLPGFKDEIVDGVVRLEKLLLAALWMSDNQENHEAYRALVNMAKKYDIVVEIDPKQLKFY